MSSGPSAAPLGKREQNKAANRAAILDAAKDVFSEEGFGAASVRDIIRRTELASGTFYNYFPDKDSIFRALIAEAAEEVRQRVREARAQATSPEGFVRDGFAAYFGFVAEDRTSFQLLQRNAGTVREIVDDALLGPGAEDLERDLHAAIEAGRLPAFDVSFITGAMVGVAFELGIRMVDRDPPDVDGATRVATDIFLGYFERIVRQS